MKFTPRSILLAIACSSALHVAAASAQDLALDLNTSADLKQNNAVAINPNPDLLVRRQLDELRPHRPDRDEIARNPNLRQRLLHQMRKDAAAEAGAARREVGRREVREQVRRNVVADADAAVSSRMQAQMRENLGQNISGSVSAQVRENLRSGIAARGSL